MQIVETVLCWNYEGEKDAEWVVHVAHPDGTVRHYEGEKDAERLVRQVHTDGTVQHYEGETVTAMFARLAVESAGGGVA